MHTGDNQLDFVQRVMESAQITSCCDIRGSIAIIGNISVCYFLLLHASEAGAAARKAEATKTREYRSKVDGRKTQLIPETVELSGGWGDGMVSLFKQSGCSSNTRRAQ